MTYCVAALVEEGIVFASDSRTSASLDNIATFSKMNVFDTPGERVIVVLSSGNLATTQGVKITLAGLAIGALAAVGIGRLMESTLFGVVSSSAWQLAGLVILVALVAVAASYLPARRMARLDPTAALRTE